MIKIFKNDLFFKIITWFAIIVSVPYFIVTLCYYNDYFTQFSVIIRLIVALFLLSLYFAFKRKNKNVVSGLICAILTLYVVSALFYLVYYPDYFVSTLIIVIISVVLFLTSLFVNSGNYFNSKIIIVSQISSIIFAILSVVSLCTWIGDCLNTLDTVFTILETIASPCCVFSIVCIDTRLGAFHFEKK